MAGTDPGPFAGLRALFAARLGARGGDIASQLRAARRALPRRVRREAEVLARAEVMARHPKLRALVDPREARRAERAVARHLGAIDPAARRRGRRLDLLAALALYLLAALGLAVAALRWRGLV